MDNFIEQLVKTYKTPKYVFMSLGGYVFGIIAAFILIFNPIVAILFAALSTFCFIYKKNLFVEYEYKFVSGIIDIDKILEMKKRITIVSFNIRDAELLAPSDSDWIKNFTPKPEKIIRCIPSTCKDKISYLAIITKGATKIMVEFTPCEELLEICFKYNPRGVKKNGIY